MNYKYRTFFLAVCAVSLVFLFQGTDAFAQNAPQNQPAGETPKEPETLLDLVMKGGALMIPIGICSLVAVYVVIMQVLSLRRDQVFPQGFREGLRDSLGSKGNEVEAALAHCEETGGPVARIFKAGIPKIGRGNEVIEKAIEDAGAPEVGKMKRQLRPLSAIAAVAPLLGLLGTVYGMIGAFQAASSAGAGKADTLAQGIYEALVTTAAGLTLAIPVLLVYQVLSGKVDAIVDEIDELAIEFLEHVGDSGSKPVSRGKGRGTSGSSDKGKAASGSEPAAASV